MVSRNVRWNAAFAAATLFLASHPSLGQGLSLAQAQRLALANAPEVEAADAAVRASRDLAVSAGHRPDPVLKLGVDNVPVTGPDAFSLGNDFMTMRRVGVMQEFTRDEKLSRRRERYEIEASKGDAEREIAIASVQRDVALAWVDRYYAGAVADVLVDQRQEALREVETAQAYYASNRGSQADVFAARGSVAVIEDRIAEAQARVQASAAALARWIGPAALEGVAGHVDLTSVPEHLLAQHADLDFHPDIVAASRAIDLARADVRVAEADRKPDWTWELSYSRRGSAYSDMVSLDVSVPLPWDRPQKQDREIAAKRALAEQAAAQREAMLRGHRAEIAAMVAEWKSGISRLRRYDTEILPLSHGRSDAALAAYRGLKGSLADVLAARRGELDVKMQRLELEAATARLWARLNFLFPVALAAREAK
jgi:outer membrane protein TolC